MILFLIHLILQKYIKSMSFYTDIIKKSFFFFRGKIKISLFCYIEKTNTPAVGISAVPISTLPPFGKLNV